MPSTMATNLCFLEAQLTGCLEIQSYGEVMNSQNALTVAVIRDIAIIVALVVWIIETL